MHHDLTVFVIYIGNIFTFQFLSLLRASPNDSWISSSLLSEIIFFPSAKYPRRTSSWWIFSTYITIIMYCNTPTLIVIIKIHWKRHSRNHFVFIFSFIFDTHISVRNYIVSVFSSDVFMFVILHSRFLVFYYVLHYAFWSYTLWSISRNPTKCHYYPSNGIGTSTSLILTHVTNVIDSCDMKN